MIVIFKVQILSHFVLKPMYVDYVDPSLVRLIWWDCWMLGLGGVILLPSSVRMATIVIVAVAPSRMVACYVFLLSPPHHLPVLSAWG